MINDNHLFLSTTTIITDPLREDSLGATLLFLLRKRAFDFFVIAFAANVSMTAGHVITKGFAAAMPAGGLTGILLGWGMLPAVCVYTKNLEKAVLR